MLTIKTKNKVIHQKPSQSAFQNPVNLCHDSLVGNRWHLSQQQHCQKWLPGIQKVSRQELHHSCLRCQPRPVSNEGGRSITSASCDYLYTESVRSIWLETDHLELLNNKGYYFNLYKNQFLEEFEKNQINSLD